MLKTAFSYAGYVLCIMYIVYVRKIFKACNVIKQYAYFMVDQDIFQIIITLIEHDRSSTVDQIVWCYMVVYLTKVLLQNEFIFNTFFTIHIITSSFYRPYKYASSCYYKILQSIEVVEFITQYCINMTLNSLIVLLNDNNNINIEKAIK